MNTFLKFTLYARNEFETAAGGKLHPDDYERIKAQFPGNPVSWGRERLELQIQRPSAELDALTALLRTLGRSLYSKRRPHVTQLGNPALISAEVVHVFDREDHDSAPFLSIDAKSKAGQHKSLCFDSPVLVRLERRVPSIGWTDCQSGPICTESVKQDIESSQFTGFTFERVRVESTRQPPEPLWEMWSDRRMPPMLSPLVDEDGNPVKPHEYANSCYTAEVEETPLYRYSAASLETMRGIDAALTCEDFGPKTKLCESRKLLVSQRFRRWAQARKVPLVHDPVMVV